MEETKMKRKTIFSIIAFTLILSSLLVLAGNVDTIYFKDKHTGADLTGVDFVLYTCTDSVCTNVNSLVFDLNSGSNNFVNYEYPSTARLNYGAYMFKECYLPHEDGYENWGDGESYTWTYELEKASGCHAPIDSFSVTNDNYVNEPVVVSMSSTLEADVHSHFQNTELEYVPAAYRDFYTSETIAVLHVFDADDVLVHTETIVRDIYMESVENVEFSWTPTEEGNYTLRITTDVTDCECMSSFEQYVEKEIVVFPERPRDECYTLLQDLEATPVFAQEDEVVTLLFNKISNYADNSYDKTPIPTLVSYEIRDASDVLVYSGSEVVSANSDEFNYSEVTLNWTPTEGGNYNIRVTGIGSSALCDGKTNPADVATLGFFVRSGPQHYVTFVVTDAETGLGISNARVNLGYQSGTTNSVGSVVFTMNSGDYDWDVWASRYYTKNGSLSVDSNFTFNVELNRSQTNVSLLYPTGGEELEDSINVRWNATNRLDHTLLIDLLYSRDGGFSWTSIISNTLNDGVYSWNTNSVMNDDSYILKVVAKNVTYGDYEEDISGVFEINNDRNSNGNDGDSNRCVPDWSCSEWGSCVNGFKTRSCVDRNNCAFAFDRPLEQIACSAGVSGNVIDMSGAEEGWTLLNLVKWIVIGILVLIILILAKLVFR